MEAKDLIDELKKIKPETEVILWEYDKKSGESIFRDLQRTAKPTIYKGFYLLLVNEHYVPKPEELSD